MLRDLPYFMKNKEWYYYDKKSLTCKLTDKAPKEAIESYKEFHNPFELEDKKQRKELEEILNN